MRQFFSVVIDDFIDLFGEPISSLMQVAEVFLSIFGAMNAKKEDVKESNDFVPTSNQAKPDINPIVDTPLPTYKQIMNAFNDAPNVITINK